MFRVVLTWLCPRDLETRVTSAPASISREALRWRKAWIAGFLHLLKGYGLRFVPSDKDTHKMMEPLQVENRFLNGGELGVVHSDISSL